MTARVTEAQATALKTWATDAGLPPYQATVRALEIGIAALVGGKAPVPERAAETKPDPASADELAALRAAIEELTDRAALTDRLVQRTLFASGAAYAAALAAAGEGASADRAEAIKGEVARDAEAVFERQLTKAREGP